MGACIKVDTLGSLLIPGTLGAIGSLEDVGPRWPQLPGSYTMDAWEAGSGIVQEETNAMYRYSRWRWGLIHKRVLCTPLGKISLFRSLPGVWGKHSPHPLTSRVRVGLSRMMSLSTTTSASSVTLHMAVVRIMLSAFRYLSYREYAIFTGCCISERRSREWVIWGWRWALRSSLELNYGGLSW